jgi:sialic acid synthase SpsE/sugar phosphate isomerase/epimerase/CBS domain-containing protein
VSDRESPVIRVGKHRIGGDAPCFIVAEIGINHNGSREQAIALIDAAVKAGADAVKFQKRSLADTYSPAVIANPGGAEQGVQYLMSVLSKVELGDDDFRAVRAHAASRGIAFLCTPWDEPSVAYLELLDIAAYKVGSPDLTNFPLIERIVATGRPMIVSTGMSSEEEVRRTLGLLKEHEAEFALLHCVSAYPAAPDEVNLRFMNTLRDWSGRPVGYSGHELGINISCAAVAMGASIVERHLTLDRGMTGPDHKASLEPADFAAQVSAIREIELALGESRRWMSRGEMLNRRTLAKSLIAARDLPAGTTLTREMIAAKSPGLGISPQEIDRLIGRELGRPVARDQAFTFEDLVGAPATTTDAIPVDVGAPWGIVARFDDFAPLVKRFQPMGMRFVEFHLSDRDLRAGLPRLEGGPFPFGLVVHGPEYSGDALVDLCADDDAARMRAVDTVERVIELARALAPQFTLDPVAFPRGPKVVIHAGGMARHGAPYDREAATARLVASLREVAPEGVELLLENLPPQPWYFGGRWDGHVMCDAASVVAACSATGLALCFDTSHAALACAATRSSLEAFAQQVRPFTRHLHVSDAAGISGEGLQVGAGAINFVDLLPRLVSPGTTVVPEVWMGHHDNGEGFRVALQRLTDLHWARDVVTRGADPRVRGTLESLKVGEGATVFGALRIIDANRMGIAFVVDAGGRVVGVVTDGDIRHAFVRGLGLHAPVVEAMTREFVFGTPEMTRAQLRSRLPGRTRVMPIVDAEGRLVDVANLWTVGDLER